MILKHFQMRMEIKRMKEKEMDLKYNIEILEEIFNYKIKLLMKKSILEEQIDTKLKRKTSLIFKVEFRFIKEPRIIVFMLQGLHISIF